jgi:hypothetical protein
MATLKDFSDVITQYDKNAGWGRYTANNANWLLSFANLNYIPGARAGVIEQLFTYYDSIKVGVLETSTLANYQVDKIHAIILPHLPEAWGGQAKNLQPEEFLKFGHLHQKILCDLIKLFEFPEFWMMASTSVNFLEKAEKEESKLIGPNDLLFDSDLEQKIISKLSFWQINYSRAIKNKKPYQPDKVCGHCYDVDYPNYHANRLGESNIVLAHAPVASDLGESSIAKFIGQLFFHKNTVPVTRVLAIGMVKNDDAVLDVDFYDYCRDHEIAGGSDEQKITIRCQKNEEFNRKYGTQFPNLKKVTLEFECNQQKKSVEVLWLRTKTTAGFKVTQNVSNENDNQLSPPVMKILKEFIEEPSGKVAIHCHDGITQASSLLLTLELMKEPKKYFQPGVNIPLIEQWVSDMREQSTRPFVPTRAIFFESIRNALRTFHHQVDVSNTPTLGGGGRRYSNVKN